MKYQNHPRLTDESVHVMGATAAAARSSASRRANCLADWIFAAMAEADADDELERPGEPSLNDTDDPPDPLVLSAAHAFQVPPLLDTLQIRVTVSSSISGMKGTSFHLTLSFEAMSCRPRSALSRVIG